MVSNPNVKIDTRNRTRNSGKCKKKNNSRLVWVRLNQLVEDKGNITKETTLIHQQGEHISAIIGKLAIASEQIQNEFGAKPKTPGYHIIDQ